MQHIQAQMQQGDTLRVANIWKDEPLPPHWRNWKVLHTDLNLPADCNLQPWQEATTQRKVRIREGSNILRWGHSPLGSFSIKEAYNLKAKFHLQPKDNIWKIVWHSHFWPKISTFLWLLVQNHILTWDNLWKRGFIGPSVCHLCLQQEESMEHLLNQCSFSAEIWDQVAQIMRKTNRARDNIINTIENWGSTAFQQPNFKSDLAVVAKFCGLENMEGEK
jgi:hypothetical protein